MHLKTLKFAKYFFTRCLHHLIFYSRVFHILVDFTTYDTVHGKAVKNKKKKY